MGCYRRGRDERRRETQSAVGVPAHWPGGSVRTRVNRRER